MFNTSVHTCAEDQGGVEGEEGPQSGGQAAQRARKHDTNPAATISTEAALRVKEVRAWSYVCVCVYVCVCKCVCVFVCLCVCV